MAPPHVLFHTSSCKPKSKLVPCHVRPSLMENPGDISLRTFKLSDVDDYMVWESDERVVQFFQDPAITSKEEALEDLRYCVIPHPWYRAICLRDRPIGFVSLDQGQGENDWYTGEIAYGLSYNYWGRGITTIALKKAIQSIFTELADIHRIEALIDKENAGSRKVIQKAGFTEECVLSKYWELKGKKTDMVKYGLFRFEMEEKREEDTTLLFDKLAIY